MKRRWWLIPIVALILLLVVLMIPRCNLLPGAVEETPMPEDEYVPISESECESLASATRRTLDVDPNAVSIDPAAEFIDPMGGSGLGCLIEIRGDGTLFKHFENVAAQLKYMFQGLGWQEDTRYLADGPTGTATAFRRGRDLAQVIVDYQPSENVSCPEDQPISACEIPPKEQIYTIFVRVAERQETAQEVDEAARAAIEASISEQVEVAPEAIDLELEPTTWPSTCLGVYRPDESCAQQITRGYRGIAQVGGLRYAVHADATGETVYLVPGAALNARQNLARQLGVDAAAITIVSAERVSWPDACLGVETGQACAEVVTPGYKVTLVVDGERYVFHTGEAGETILLAEAPEIVVDNPLVTWSFLENGICQIATFTTDAVIYGPCDGPMIRGIYPSAERAATLSDFLRTYAPFEEATEAGAITFAGQGAQIATPGEQRMIAEWARVTALETRGGPAGPAYGLVLKWHREGGIAGFCDDLTIYVTGDVYASNCQGEEPVVLGRRRLSGELLAEFYSWVDSYGDFNYDFTDPGTADAMTMTLVFDGNGNREPTEEEIQQMLDIASRIYAAFTQ